MSKLIKRLSTKVDKHTGKSEIIFRFIGGYRIEARAKSGIFINPKQWNEKKGELKTATVGNEEAAIKRKLDDLCNTIVDTYTTTDKEQINKEWLSIVIDKFHYPEKYEVQAVAAQSFFDAFDEFLQVRKLSQVRENNFKVVKRALQRFELYTDTVLTLDELTDDIIRAFAKFLTEEHTYTEKRKYKAIYNQLPDSRPPQPRGQNTINAILIKLRTFCNWCIEQDKAGYNLKFKVQQSVYGTPIYITIDERKQIEGADLTEHPQLAKQRDIFIFQCCIGCRVGDLYKLTRENIVNGSIQYVPRKTKDGNPHTVTVPLNATATAILKRYEADTDLLPLISEQKYNDAIKRVFELAGVTRVVQVRNTLTGESEPRPINEVASSHLARRTFVGNLYKHVKDPNLVGALSGHKEGSKAFARYRDIDDDMKKDLVQLLD